MSANFTLTGTENLRRIFQDFPEGGYRKPIRAAFRKAARPVASAMSSNLPSSLKGMKKIIKTKQGKGKSLTCSVGFSGVEGMYRNSKGQLWNPYMLVYWFNYGTLSNRLASHQFKSPRRRKTASWKGGLMPGQFVEQAWEQSKNEAAKIFETEVDKEICNFYRKHALQ